MFEFNLDWDHILSNSYMNCHVRGLHSISFAVKEDGRRIRMFVHEPGGALSFKGELKIAYPDLPISIHPHNRDLTLIGLSGTLLNYTVMIDKVKGVTLDEWRFSSRITDDRRKRMFTLTDAKRLSVVHQKALQPGDSLYLPAHMLHTVTCHPTKPTAWLIIEGDWNPHYQSVCYSNCDLEQVSDVGLYQPIRSAAVIEDILKKANLPFFTPA